MHILLTGGGTAGHVIPNIAIAEAIRVASRRGHGAAKFDKEVKITYIGSYHGIEKGLCKEAEIPFEAIHAGKLRRYLSLHNIPDFFRIPIGIMQAFFKLLRLRPNVVFSKGGYIGFPVVFAAWLIGIPVIIHESDASLGLATKLTAPFAKKIFLAYEAPKKFASHYAGKIEIVGNPVRLRLFEGDKKKGLEYLGFDGSRPILLVMGGSSGSEQLNEVVLKELDDFLNEFDVVHVTGDGKENGAVKRKHYVSLPFIGKELPHVLAAASFVICRAGANTLAELEALYIPALLYPLGRHASRGDQFENAKALCRRSPLFRIADEDMPAFKQLMFLPKREDVAQIEQASMNETDGCTQKIAFTLLSDTARSADFSKKL